MYYLPYGLTKYFYGMCKGIIKNHAIKKPTPYNLLQEDFLNHRRCNIFEVTSRHSKRIVNCTSYFEIIDFFQTNQHLMIYFLDAATQYTQKHSIPQRFVSKDFLNVGFLDVHAIHLLNHRQLYLTKSLPRSVKYSHTVLCASIFRDLNRKDLLGLG